ncbi:RBBP9/YdeN family alpha/beta hydrolase [Novosphingobium sp.]|uniref:RBBP9/YdeN family alpha/beta hydrolase n=1 Tax=Novosphingobium sp. TaxID=1874826 RepID=UPI0038B915C2
MADDSRRRSSGSPMILTVPGLGNSGPGHWQSLWEAILPDCHRVDLGLWDDPHRNTWVNKINLAIARAGRPVVLVAHSLGCHAVAWWAEYELRGQQRLSGEAAESPVIGALLVAPPDVEERPLDRRLTRFAPVPGAELPFPAIVVGSRDDPYATVGQARRMARTWGARFADAGGIGHINAQSGIGPWAFGRLLLNQLLPEPLSLDEGARDANLTAVNPVPVRIDPALRRLGA